MKHCCRVQVILKEFICSNIECIGDGDQLLQFWSLHASLYYTHVINAVIYSGGELFLCHAGFFTGCFDSFSQRYLVHTVTGTHDLALWNTDKITGYDFYTDASYVDIASVHVK